MGSSYTDINIHIIFHTKDISPVMKEEDLSRIFHYIGGIIRALHAHVYMIGGRPDQHSYSGIIARINEPVRLRAKN